MEKRGNEYLFCSKRFDSRLYFDGEKSLLKYHRSQVWIETVVYTLIGLAIIGLIMGFATPKIKQLIDQSVIDQSVSMLTELDSKISIVNSGIGNSRKVSIRIKKGELLFDCINDTIVFTLRGTGYKASELGRLISDGIIERLTQQPENGSKIYDVSLTLKYAGGLNLTYAGKDFNQLLTKAPTNYNLLIENNGQSINLVPQ